MAPTSRTPHSFLSWPPFSLYERSIHWLCSAGGKEKERTNERTNEKTRTLKGPPSLLSLSYVPRLFSTTTTTTTSPRMRQRSPLKIYSRLVTKKQNLPSSRSRVPLYTFNHLVVVVFSFRPFRFRPINYASFFFFFYTYNNRT